MKKRVALSFICLALVFGLTTGALAAGNMEAISAYLNRGIKIVYNGQTKTMNDANGKVIYPISYNGTTYLPVRAVAGMLGVDANWDGATSTVYLGKIPEGIDFIDNIKPYAGSGHFSTADKLTRVIAGKTYDHFIISEVNYRPHYDLAGKYDTLTFKAYCKDNATIKLYFWGDNDTLIDSFEIKGLDLPKEYTVKLNGVQQLMIDTKGYTTYLFDMNIK